MSADGERTRLREQVERMRALLHGFELTIVAEVPCSESAQAIADAGIRLATAAGRHDAYQRCEADIDVYSQRQKRISKLPGSRT